MSAPTAVVLAPTTWEVGLLKAARQRWVAAPIVLMDPPPDLGAAGVIVGSWSDPLALPSLVSSAIGPPMRLDSACAAIVHLVAESVGRDLRVSRLLSALVVASEDAHSSRLGLRFLHERMLRVLEAFEWIETAPLGGPDLVEALLASQLRHAESFRRRHLRLEVQGMPRLALRRPGESSRIAEALCSHLLRLPPGVVTVRSEGPTILCCHPNLVANDSFPLLVAVRGLQANGIEVTLADGVLRATRSEASDVHG